LQGHAAHQMDTGHHELAERVRILGLHPRDHVLGAGDRLGGDHSLECADLVGGVSRGSHLSPDESRHPGCPGSWVDVPSPRYRPSMGCDRCCSRGAGAAAPGSPTPRYQLWRPDTRTGSTPPPGGA
jgi:hypothetical protein